MKIVPRTGMVVIDPATNQALPADGVDLELDSYWIRRLKDGDVCEKKEEKPAATAPTVRRSSKTKGTEGT